MLDFAVDNFTDIAPLTAYLPGISQTDVAADATYYLHADHLGSTWYTSLYNGSEFVVSKDNIRTAFGERVNQYKTTPSRYGYAGAWGYQEHDVVNVLGAVTPDERPDSILNASPTAGLPFMHVGYRYYDPGSGRFLQRDPIGIRGGLNVYSYSDANPLSYIDPYGLWHVGHDGVVQHGGQMGKVGSLPGYKEAVTAWGAGIVDGVVPFVDPIADWVSDDIDDHPAYWFTCDLLKAKNSISNPRKIPYYLKRLDRAIRPRNPSPPPRMNWPNTAGHHPLKDK